MKSPENSEILTSLFHSKIEKRKLISSRQLRLKSIDIYGTKMVQIRRLWLLLFEGLIGAANLNVEEDRFVTLLPREVRSVEGRLDINLHSSLC